MNTILTDDELPPLQPQDHPEPHSFAWTEQEMRAIRARDRLVEAAVLAKLREQEPVAWMREGWGPDCGPYVEIYRDDEMGWRDRKEWTPLYAAPLPAVVQVPQGWRLEVDESAIYHNDKRIAVLEEDGGNQSWRDACALGQQIVDRMNAAHEAPAQAEFVHDPACKMCEGRGYYVAGYSGREDDGNAPIHEECDCWIPNPEAPAQASAVDERDRKDAERYRFIRNADRSDPHLPYQALMAYACESFDEAIDDAMEEEARAALAQKGGAA